MCSSMYAAASFSCDRAASALSSSTPCSRSASGSAIPSRSVSVRSSSWSRIEPAAADEPKSERPKRAPSSSAQDTSRTVTGGSPSDAIRRSTSAPASTLRQPSSHPPFGTESRCPPISNARVGRAAQREPLVPGLVDLLDRAGAFELRAEELPRLLPRVRPRDPLSAVFVARQRAQLVQFGDRARGFQCHDSDPKP